MDTGTQNWRELLGTIIRDSSERQRISEELGVNPVTLTRWANNESTPRMRNLRYLLRVLPPQNRELMAELFQEDFSDSLVTDEGHELSLNENLEIPSLFYSHVFDVVTTSPEVLRFWSISNLVLQQALTQLDPNRIGMSIMVVRCMPPDKDHKIRSLRESVGVGTPPWSHNLESNAIFLGAESLAGYAVTACRSAEVQNFTKDTMFYPASQRAYEESAVASPIIYANRVAGCLLVSSTHPSYFQPSRLKLIQNFASIMLLAFEQDEFYSPEYLDLRVMPPLEVQKNVFSTFRRRIAHLMMESSKTGKKLNNVQAEQIVWQQLEEEILQA